jgi:hypothetical protein
MNTRKPPERLLSLPEFLAENPHITPMKLQWAVRNRKTNGLDKHVYKRAYGVALYVDAKPTAAFFTAVVKA